jgi:hypothetical protein
VTKKKQKELKPDYAEFCLRFTNLCIKLLLLFSKLVYTLCKPVYKKIQVWLIDKQMKKLERQEREMKKLERQEWEMK